MKRSETECHSSATLLRGMDVADLRASNVKVEPDDEEMAMQAEMQAGWHSISHISHTTRSPHNSS